MKTLYFDIDGTVLLNDRHEVKVALSAGALEDAIREAGFTDLVCVGNFATIAHTAKRLDPDYDELGVLLELCCGAFLDEAWFRRSVTLVADAESRADQIDFSGDWWYVDDLAEHYMQTSGLRDIFAEHDGVRIFSPAPLGSGRDVLRWLREVVR